LFAPCYEARMARLARVIAPGLAIQALSSKKSDLPIAV
jgi:hypothetical protein